MLYCYLDDNFLSYDPGDPLEDVFIFGGFVIDSQHLRNLRFDFAVLKTVFGIRPSLPIKYNLRDQRLRQIYEYETEPDTLRQLLEVGSDNLRLESLRMLHKYPTIIFCAATRGYRDVQANRKVYYQWSFQNVIQRIGMMAANKEMTISESEGSASIFIVLDWPPQFIADKSLFKLYQQAYYYGKGQSKQSTFYCGQLRKLGFYTTPLVSSVYHDPMLQLTDLVVGAVKDFLSFCLTEKPECERTANLFMPLITPLIRRRDGEILRYGMVLAPQYFYDRVREKIGRYVSPVSPLSLPSNPRVS